MKLISEYPTWEELLKMPSGTILKHWKDGMLDIIIMRGPSSLCAYIGVPKDHPLSGKGYITVNLKCYCGLTYGNPTSPNNYKDSEHYYFGWHYDRENDYCFYYDHPILSKYDHSHYKKWLLQDVEKDMEESIIHFKKTIWLSNIFYRIKKFMKGGKHDTI